MKVNAAKLFSICADRGLSLTDLKMAAGVSYRTLQKIKNGRAVNVCTVGKLAGEAACDDSQIVQERNSSTLEMRAGVFVRCRQGNDCNEYAARGPARPRSSVYSETELQDNKKRYTGPAAITGTD